MKPGWWVWSRCDQTRPRRAGGRLGTNAHSSPSLRAALRGATARSASRSTILMRLPWQRAKYRFVIGLVWRFFLENQKED